MQKILTISIAAYNVEKYIRCALNSLLICEDLLNLLEIFVIDDGGSDSTLSIAKEYERKYPGIIYAVHKEAPRSRTISASTTCTNRTTPH